MTHKTTFRIGLLVLLTLLGAGCKKQAGNNTPDNKSVLNYLHAWNSGTEYDDLLLVWNDRWYDVFSNTYSDDAQVVAGMARPKLADLFINNDSIPHDSFFHINKLDSRLVSDIFGNQISISSSGGKGYTSFNKMIYAPKNLSISFSGVTNQEIKRASGFRVAWNVDVLNKNDIVVVLKSDVNPNLYFSKFVRDNAGSYSFTESDLSVFPPNEEVRIYLVRGTEETYTQGSRTMAIRIGNLITCPSMTIR